MNISLRRPLADGFGTVTQWFGEHPENYAKYKIAGHNGLDYGVALGTPVSAAHVGEVVTGNDPAGWGLFVRVVMDMYSTIYAHLSQIAVKDGDIVKAGQQIGLSGSTGNSTGSHLHFGLRVGRAPAYSDYIDPLPFRDI
jgi:murein DD-endopeptidase MepM/ murein hydrolase activator NlpD